MSRHAMRSLTVLISTALALLGCCAPPAAANPMYTVTELTMPGGVSNEAYDLNSRGQAIGAYYVPSDRNVLRTFLYSDGVMTDVAGPDNIFGSGINDAGQITRGTDRAINNLGQTVGVAYHDGANQNYYTENGVRVDLPTNHAPTAINNRGQVVGGIFGPNTFIHPFLYSDGKVTDLGLLPGTPTADATSINDQGFVVGGPFWGVGHAFLYDGSKLHDLGTLGGAWSRAFDINNRNQIVGSAEIDDNSPSHAFLYTDGMMLDLNDLIPKDSDLLIDSAKAINDSGQILARGYRFSEGESRVLLLTPISAPEPSTLALLGMTLAFCTIHRVLRRRGRSTH